MSFLDKYQGCYKGFLRKYKGSVCLQKWDTRAPFKVHWDLNIFALLSWFYFVTALYGTLMAGSHYSVLVVCVVSDRKSHKLKFKENKKKRHYWSRGHLFSHSWEYEYIMSQFSWKSSRTARDETVSMHFTYAQAFSWINTKKA